MGVRVEGLERSKLVPQEIITRLERFKRELVPPLVADFIVNEPRNSGWPKGRRKTIQEQTKGVIKGDHVIIGTFHSRYARALDTGFTVKPKPGKVLRWRGRDGTWQFSKKPVTHHARPYFARVLNGVPRIVAVVYDRTFAGVGS